MGEVDSGRDSGMAHHIRYIRQHHSVMVLLLIYLANRCRLLTETDRKFIVGNSRKKNPKPHQRGDSISRTRGQKRALAAATDSQVRDGRDGNAILSFSAQHAGLFSSTEPRLKSPAE